MVLIGARAADGSDRFIYNQNTGALFFDADGSGGGAQIQIATLSTNLNLSSGNFYAYRDAQANDVKNLTGPLQNGTGNGGGNGSNGSNGGGGNGGNPPSSGTPGNDMLTGNGGSDTLLGLGGNDMLTGSGGNDILKGGAGNDTIRGGVGNDLIWGGLGRDIIALEYGPGRDVIRDFNPNGDKLGLTPGLSYGQLEIEQRGRNVVISDGRDQMAVLIGVKLSQ
ncbi:MAG TPA: hypothetical protein V6C88_09405 [Chroococcidiopsis sp.]